MAHPHAKEAAQQQAGRLYRVAGRKTGGAVTRNEVKAMIHKHEAHDHKGEPRTKLASGGRAEGGKSAKRGDKKPRGNTHINIMLGHPGAGTAPTPPVVARPVPVPVAARGPAPPPTGPAAPPMRPPMAGPMGPMKKGGRAKHKDGGTVKLESGAGGGLGRLAKAGIKAKKR
ncbi:MAG: hypothetical protein KGL35_00050 [Bradyrhizobium sp.]|nr:hypothetical protein [Bradyrhizobium sp.]